MLVMNFDSSCGFSIYHQCYCGGCQYMLEVQTGLVAEWPAENLGLLDLPVLVLLLVVVNHI